MLQIIDRIHVKGVPHTALEHPRRIVLEFEFVLALWRELLALLVKASLCIWA